MGQTKQRQEGWKVPGVALIGFALPTCTRTHARSDLRTHVQPLHSPPPCPYMSFREGEEREVGRNMLSPNPHPSIQQWTAPCAADWSDCSKESAYMCGEKKSITKTHWQINIIYGD